MEKKRPSAANAVQITDFQQIRDRVPVAQHVQSAVSDAERTLHRSLPVRILVLQRRKNFVQMEVVAVANERTEHAVPLGLPESELQILRAEVGVRLQTGNAEE